MISSTPSRRPNDERFNCVPHVSYLDKQATAHTLPVVERLRRPIECHPRVSPCTLSFCSLTTTPNLGCSSVLPPFPPRCAPRGVLVPSLSLKTHLFFSVKERPRIVPISPYCPSNDICPAAEAARVLRCVPSIYRLALLSFPC